MRSNFSITTSIRSSITMSSNTLYNDRSYIFRAKNKLQAAVEVLELMVYQHNDQHATAAPFRDLPFLLKELKGDLAILETSTELGRSVELQSWAVQLHYHILGVQYLQYPGSMNLYPRELYEHHVQDLGSLISGIEKIRAAMHKFLSRSRREGGIFVASGSVYSYQT